MAITSQWHYGIIGSSSLHLWLVSLRITEIEQKPLWLQDWGPYWSRMDLSGQAENTMLLVGEFFPQKREIIILFNETLEAKVHTPTKDSDTILIMKSNSSPSPPPFFCLFVCLVVPAWKNIPLRFSLYFWVSFSLSGHFYFLNSVFTFFQTLA